MVKHLHVYELLCPWRNSASPVIRYVVAETKPEALDAIEKEWRYIVARECPEKTITYHRGFQAMKTRTLNRDEVIHLMEEHKYSGNVEGLAQLLNRLPEAM